MNRNDILNSIAEQLEDARAEGYAEGIVQGTRQVIINMINSGLSNELIASIMEISVEQVQQYA